MAKVACFGELLLRLAAPGRELLLQRPQLDVYVGGAEANVAVALACLGHDTKMISRIPDSPLGRAAARYLRQHGVDASNVAAAPGRMGLYFLAAGAGRRASEIVYDREGSSFALASPGDYDWNRLLEGVDLLHMSGITPALGARPQECAMAAAEAASRLGVAISFDGNYRARLWERADGEPREALCRLVDKAEILFGNHRDISLLLGKAIEDGRTAAEAAFSAFPGLKLIASTSRRIEDADRHFIAARVDTLEEHAETEEVEVAGIVDRIGAGDAFAAGVLHGVRDGLDLNGTVRAGLSLACLKHSLPGDASLFGPADIEAFLAGELDVRR